MPKSELPFRTELPFRIVYEYFLVFRKRELSGCDIEFGGLKQVVLLYDDERPDPKRLRRDACRIIQEHMPFLARPSKEIIYLGPERVETGEVRKP